MSIATRALPPTRGRRPTNAAATAQPAHITSVLVSVRSSPTGQPVQ